MSMIQKIEIDGKQVPSRHPPPFRVFIASSSTEISTRISMRSETVMKVPSHLDMFSLEMFENIAYIMAKHADSSIPDSPEEWLDEFSTFSIYQVLPKIIELWGLNVQTDVESKKNFTQLTAR